MSKMCKIGSVLKQSGFIKASIVFELVTLLEALLIAILLVKVTRRTTAVLITKGSNSVR